MAISRITLNDRQLENLVCINHIKRILISQHDADVFNRLVSERNESNDLKYLLLCINNNEYVLNYLKAYLNKQTIDQEDIQKLLEDCKDFSFRLIKKPFPSPIRSQVPIQSKGSKKSVNIYEVPEKLPSESVFEELHEGPAESKSTSARPSSPGFFARHPKATTTAICSVIGAGIGIALLMCRTFDVLTCGLSLFITIPATIALFGLAGGLLGYYAAKNAESTHLTRQRRR